MAIEWYLGSKHNKISTKIDPHLCDESVWWLPWPGGAN